MSVKLEPGEWRTASGRRVVYLPDAPHSSEIDGPDSDRVYLMVEGGNWWWYDRDGEIGGFPGDEDRIVGPWTDPSDDLSSLRAENERLSARVTELEGVISEHRKGWDYHPRRWWLNERLWSVLTTEASDA